LNQFAENLSYAEALNAEIASIFMNMEGVATSQAHSPLQANPTSTAFSRFCRFDEGKCFVFNKSWSKEQNSDE
jgi:hypothetical protein